ncbi:hypothetical protein CROQUDRAFT_655235 [Cronartium quercuum f. sp. fusiforme G11]|uniref:RRM Nup35-type domain-containing protein n=1 Tax=Cronartium quercuum f. sp. fusiforme G11 TaxID=708437 RepID=A0A9P6NR81_9BASI|nr:hypothetical protein CROQUDRAFT_655235 [Cronartium quercuum f. sp. fusiforme G11]
MSSSSDNLPSHYNTGYISSTQSHHQNNNSDSTIDQDDWIIPNNLNTRTRNSNLNNSIKSTYRPGALFAPKENMPLRNSRSVGLFGSTTKFAHSVKSKRLSDALEDDAPPKQSLFDDDLNQSKSKNDPSAHRTMVSSLSNHQSQSHQSQPDPTPETQTNSGYKVYVFGFVQSQQAFVLKHFTSIGELLHSPEPSVDGGNWVTITYKHNWAAQRAIRKNGEILGGVIMIGCKAVDEHQIGLTTNEIMMEPKIGISKSSSMIISKPVKTFDVSDSVFASPNQVREGGIRGLVNGAGKPDPSIFQKSSDSIEGSGTSSNSYFNRALDLIFGW